MANRHNFFLPYMRQGLAAAQKESLSGATRIVLDVAVNLKAKDEKETHKKSINKQIALLGPGDVIGINSRIIKRVAPALHTNNFEENYTPFMEFSEPDFLWRFSTRKTEDGNNWLPWLSLIVLKAATAEEEAEFVEISNKNSDLPACIQLNNNVILPDLKESWRWAHVHLLDIEGTTQNQIIEEIKKTPQKAVCRLLCSRRLQAQTKYHAFLVPTYRIGADAALGLSGTNDGAALTWENPTESVGQLPYYYTWEFRTGTQGDFETLVRKLKPQALKELGTQTIDCSNPGFGLTPETTEMQLEAALMSLDTNYQAWGMDEAENSFTPNSTQQNLIALLNRSKEGDKLTVTPPIYGEWYAGVANKDKKLKDKKRHWLEEVNLDFRHRAAAGLGVQFVKENQEGLMKAAWEQHNKVQEANRTLNLGRFGRSISSCLYKRLDKMENDSFFKMTLSLQNKVSHSDGQRGVTGDQISIGGYLKDSLVSNKLSQVKVKKYLPQKRVTPPDRNRSNQEKTEHFAPITNPQLVSLAFRVQGTNNTAVRLRTNRASYQTWNLAPRVEENRFDEIGQNIRTSLAPKKTIANPLANRIKGMRKWEKHTQYSSAEEGSRGVNDTALDELRPILWFPEFHRPMYHFLRKLSQEYILAGVEKIPPNTLGLLQTNRRFIEAFMLGANHEFASELRWREFPTDMKGSYFRSFWDTSIYSLDEHEQNIFRNEKIGKRFFDNIQKKYGQLKDENGNLAYNTMPKIEALYSKGEPSETEKEIADAYEVAVEKWLLTRNEDKDIEQISSWTKSTRLGDHPVPTFSNNQGNANQLVLAVRGELLQKFSNTLIYLTSKKGGKPDFKKRLFPVFEGKLPPDIVFIGFELSEAQARENKHFLIFEERMTELRFGLDSTRASENESDFSWEDFGIAESDYLDAQQPLLFADKWNSAAYVGKVMLQKQLRVAIELKEMLPPEE